MGKTTLMKKAAMDIPEFQAAAAVGRLISFDCSLESQIRDTLKWDLNLMRKRWWGLMVMQHICRFFSDRTYPFKGELITIPPLGVGDLASFALPHELDTLKTPIKSIERFFLSVIASSDPFGQLKEITNHFFGVTDDTPALVLLNNMQYLKILSRLQKSLVLFS
eukprot:TRINITY_DN1928_c0_g1_i1.p1 TRINITY_DN1928_c0_g1~~TRINITY_DN1928_c0_g1_i1.p1  ORF type:complete len:164 (-),score=15.06 TRINITY_DN1928_c0_g1_i1:146-637(-)